MRADYVAVSRDTQSNRLWHGRLSSVFCQEAGFEHVSRYISGLLLSANKTVQGIHSQWVFPPGTAVSRRAMHEAVFEAGWNRERLLVQHRAMVSQQHQGHGPAVISID